MDPNERINSFQVALQEQIRGNQVTIWTALPCIVESYDAEKMIVTLQAAIQMNQQDIKTGKVTAVNLPLFTEVPVQFPGGGDFVFTFPLKKGDEGIGIFSARCIDSWWQSGGVQKQAEYRLHDLSDCMFIPKIFSQPNVIADVNTDVPELRNKTGTIKLGFTALGFEITGNLNVNGDISATGTISWPQGTFGAAGAVVDGVITATGDVVAGQGGLASVHLKTHTHPTAAVGPPSSPTPGS